MQEFRASKNVTLSMDSIIVVRRKMQETRRNFSKALDLIIKDYSKIQEQIAEHKKWIQDQENIKHLERISKPELIKVEHNNKDNRQPKKRNKRN